MLVGSGTTYGYQGNYLLIIFINAWGFIDFVLCVREGRTFVGRCACETDGLNSLSINLPKTDQSRFFSVDNFPTACG